MRELKVEMTCGGIADWHRKLPISETMRTVPYEATMIAKLTVEGQDAPSYCRAIWSGMDEVDDAGHAPTGFGLGSFQDIRTGDRLVFRVDWYSDERQEYKGTFQVSSGTGKWLNVTGEIEVDLEFCAVHEGESVAADDPVLAMGFLEGRGTLVSGT
ncbi:hypothetical protein [Pseudonocardia sp. H11422]|uniref:hypothetical protein n=1 Tax=Pseudonocardia sp. H11422 TaxID=2835866 RepID=UPI001BDCC83F|nr:hypothetical protein [Pseudonocardia sp. H11422]